MPSQKSYLDQVHTLAVGVAHLLLGKAVPEWPTSTRAHPSFWVTVLLQPAGSLWPEAARYFPFRVRWDIWENVVVPILTNPDHQFLPDNGAGRNWRKIALLDAGAYDQIVGDLQEALIANAKAVGFLPADPPEATPYVSPPVAPGEPVDRTPGIDEGVETFLRYDEEVKPPVYEKFD